MPDWAQRITYLNPVRYFIEVLRLVMLKGSNWADISEQVWILGVYAIGINALAIWNYRKQI
jgi:ABC-2 type transport system permease protein